MAARTKRLNHQAVLIRAPRQLIQQVRDLSVREGEVFSVTLRRLIRRGLAAELRRG